ncbi:MAG TPA: hypothetical protein PKA00_17575 [Saprospiraceae bacterium]|nr:hypothetical protein [Saprospiraceae bacterium]HMQ84732.1 hypothetical protein [Saprospiraceae bacterium]
MTPETAANTSFKRMQKILLFSLLFYWGYGLSQSRPPDLTPFQDSVQQIETLHYTATYRFQGFGSDTFEIRSFEVFARRNNARNGYGFDWEIVQHDEEIGESRLVLTGSEFFNIVKSNRGIGYRGGVDRFPAGDYMEHLRWITLWDEFLFDFDGLYAPADVDFQPMDGGTALKIRIDKYQDRILCFPANSCLPDRVVNTVRNEELGLEQVMETSLSDIQVNTVLPDSVLVPQYYLNQGYELRQKAQRKKDRNCLLRRIACC